MWWKSPWKKFTFYSESPKFQNLVEQKSRRSLYLLYFQILNSTIENDKAEQAEVKSAEVLDEKMESNQLEDTKKGSIEVPNTTEIENEKLEASDNDDKLSKIDSTSHENNNEIMTDAQHVKSEDHEPVQSEQSTATIVPAETTPTSTEESNENNSARKSVDIINENEIDSADKINSDPSGEKCAQGVPNAENNDRNYEKTEESDLGDKVKENHIDSTAVNGSIGEKNSMPTESVDEQCSVTIHIFISFSSYD